MPRPGHQRLLRELAYVVVLGAPLALFFLVAMPRANAAKLLKGLGAVQVSHTHFAQVEQLAAQFGSHAACVGNNCLFQFQNQWMHWLHLAPLTEFSVMVQRQGSPGDPGGGEVGALDMAMLVNSSVGDGGAIASAVVFERSAGGAYDASITFGADGKPGRTVVTMAPGVSPRQRARARAFNLACLTRIGGCRTSRDLLPGVWQGARRIQSVGLENQAPASRWRTAVLTSGARN